MLILGISPLCLNRFSNTGPYDYPVEERKDNICIPILGCQMKLKWLRRLYQFHVESCSLVASDGK